jgi:hypothetical protein
MTNSTLGPPVQKRPVGAWHARPSGRLGRKQCLRVFGRDGRINEPLGVVHGKKRKTNDFVSIEGHIKFHVSHFPNSPKLRRKMYTGDCDPSG